MKEGRNASKRFVVAACIGVVIAVFGAPSSADAQSYRGRGVSPIFDGWETLADGSRLFYFGYINRASTPVTIPLGPTNTFEPGPADRSQPTIFLPGRHEHVFTIKAAADFKGKFVWTVTSDAGTQTANASPDQLYILEVRENDSPNAKPPQIKVTDLTAKVGAPLTLLPAITPAVSSGRAAVEGAAAEAAGLNVTWSEYRGPATVTFSAAPAEPAADGRGAARGAAAAGRGRGRGAAPAVGMFPVSCGGKPTSSCGAAIVQFTEPGSYMLRIDARQDGLEAINFVRVNVSR